MKTLIKWGGILVLLVIVGSVLPIAIPFVLLFFVLKGLDNKRQARLENTIANALNKSKGL